MKIVGLTGGIGSGKSTVVKMFQELGAVAYIADIEAKKLMNSDFDLIQKIKKLFGNEAYSKGELNRKYIASIIFNDAKKLTNLNKLVHPKVREHFINFTKNLKTEVVIYEAAILFESGSNTMCDYIITVIADFEDKIERIMKRDDVSKQQITDRMKHQLEDDFKIKKSDFLIKNKDLATTKLQVKTIYSQLLKLPKN